VRRLTDTDVEVLRELARSAHANQTDKLGRDYFEAHLAPIAAGLRDFGPAAELAGWLHDIIEDTHHDVNSLRAAGVPDEVIVAVESVTKIEGEPYERLIDRACANPLGRVVKLVDNAWNLISAPRLSKLTPGVAEDLVRRKYRPARATLLAALGWAEEGPEMARICEVLVDFDQELGNQMGMHE